MCVCLIFPVFNGADWSIGLLIVSTQSISAALAEIWKMDVLLNAKETKAHLIFHEEQSLCTSVGVCLRRTGLAPRKYFGSALRTVSF